MPPTSNRKKSAAAPGPGVQSSPSAISQGPPVPLRMKYDSRLRLSALRTDAPHGCGKIAPLEPPGRRLALLTVTPEDTMDSTWLPLSWTSIVSAPATPARTVAAASAGANEARDRRVERRTGSECARMDSSMCGST